MNESSGPSSFSSSVTSMGFARVPRRTVVVLVAARVGVFARVRRAGLVSLVVASSGWDEVADESVAWRVRRAARVGAGFSALSASSSSLGSSTTVGFVVLPLVGRGI